MNFNILCGRGIQQGKPGVIHFLHQAGTHAQAILAPGRDHQRFAQAPPDQLIALSLKIPHLLFLPADERRKFARSFALKIQLGPATFARCWPMDVRLFFSLRKGREGAEPFRKGRPFFHAFGAEQAVFRIGGGAPLVRDQRPVAVINARTPDRAAPRTQGLRGELMSSPLIWNSSYFSHSARRRSSWARVLREGM